MPFDPSDEAVASMNSVAIDAPEDVIDEDLDVGTQVMRHVVDLRLVDQCVALKLVGKVMMALPGQMNQRDKAAFRRHTLTTLDHLLQRIERIRADALQTMSITPDSQDYPQVFNATTDAVLDLLAHERRLKHLHGDEAVGEQTVSILPTLIRHCQENFPKVRDRNRNEAMDASIAKTIAVLRCAPRVMELITYFDYFQKNVEGMHRKLWMKVVSQAEKVLGILADGQAITDGRLVLKVYRVVMDTLSSVYRFRAEKDVERLSRMSELGRSLEVTQFTLEEGIDYSHVLSEFEDTMRGYMELYTGIMTGAQVKDEEVDEVTPDEDEDTPE